MPDRLTVEDVERYLSEIRSVGGMPPRVAKQLADTMRENERLLDFYKCFGIAHDRDGARVVQSDARGSVLEKYKALSNKDSEHGCRAYRKYSKNSL